MVGIIGLSKWRIFKILDLIVPEIIEKEPLTQVFSFIFCKIFKNTFFTEHRWTAAFKKWPA